MPAAPHTETFAALFAGSDRARMEWRPDSKAAGKGKAHGKYVTVPEPAGVANFAAHLSGSRGLTQIPIRADGSARWGAIDVDGEGLDLVAMASRVQALRLPLTVCRSKSGGAHLYFFLPDWAPAADVRRLLKTWAAALGHPGVEVFPKQDRLGEDEVGNGINLPYFDAEATTRYAVDDGAPAPLLRFLSMAEGLKTPIGEAEQITIPTPADLDGAPPCLTALAVAGFPPGTRNISLFSLGVYCRMRYGDTWEPHIDEMNRAYMTPPLPSSEVVQIVRSLKRRKYFYKCKDFPLSGLCDKKRCASCKHGIGEAENHDVGVDFVGLAKITSDPPVWILTVRAGEVEARLELGTEELMAWPAVRRKCVERLNILPGNMKGSQWERTVSDFLKEVEEFAAPEDSGPDGEFWALVEDFCVSRAPALTRDEILLGKPWTEDGHTWFRAPDLRAFLERKKFRGGTKFGPHKMFAIVRRMGGGSDLARISGKPTRVWSVPAFARQDRPFETQDAASTRTF